VKTTLLPHVSWLNYHFSTSSYDFSWLNPSYGHPNLGSAGRRGPQRFSGAFTQLLEWYQWRSEFFVSESYYKWV
jgi:hypothetical protein